MSFAFTFPVPNDDDPISSEETQSSMETVHNAGISNNSGTVWTDTSSQGRYSLSELKDELFSMGIPWSSEIESAVAGITPIAPFVGVPWYYVEVLKAGSGGYGTVVLCLPRPYVVAAKINNARRSPFTVADLISKLVAVKVTGCCYDIEYAQLEVKSLKILTNRIRESVGKAIPRFATLQSHFSTSDGAANVITTDSSYWFAMEAVVPSLSISEIWEDRLEDLGNLQSILLLQVFLETMESVAFLHGCTPPLCHGDIHGENILLGLTNDLPRVVLVDLGCATIASDQDHEEFEEDYENVRNITQYMFRRARERDLVVSDEILDTEESWKTFKTLMMGDEPSSFEHFLKSLVPLARTALASVTSERRVDLTQALAKISMEQEGKLVTNFQSLGLIPTPYLNNAE